MVTGQHEGIAAAFLCRWTEAGLSQQGQHARDFSGTEPGGAAEQSIQHLQARILDAIQQVLRILLVEQQLGLEQQPSHAHVAILQGKGEGQFAGAVI